MFLKCELFYPLIETYFPLQLYTENIGDASDSCILQQYMFPERVKSKRESMRNVEMFLYVNTIAANLNKIVANKTLVLLHNFL